jgi:hypothetical protein
MRAEFGRGWRVLSGVTGTPDSEREPGAATWEAG